MLCKKDILENLAKFTGLRPATLLKKRLWHKACSFIKETLAQLFSCEFYEISNNTFFNRTPLVAASGFIFNRSPLFEHVYYQ